MSRWWRWHSSQNSIWDCYGSFDEQRLFSVKFARFRNGMSRWWRWHSNAKNEAYLLHECHVLFAFVTKWYHAPQRHTACMHTFDVILDPGETSHVTFMNVTSECEEECVMSHMHGRCKNESCHAYLQCYSGSCKKESCYVHKCHIRIRRVSHVTCKCVTSRLWCDSGSCRNESRHASFFSCLVTFMNVKCACVWVCVRVCVCVSRECIYSTPACVCVCVCTYVYVYLCVCVCVYGASACVCLLHPKVTALFPSTLH